MGEFRGRVKTGKFHKSHGKSLVHFPWRDFSLGIAQPYSPSMLQPRNHSSGEAATAERVGLWDTATTLCCVRIVTESQNHRMLGVGRDLCGLSSPTLLLKQGHLQQAAQDLT